MYYNRYRYFDPNICAYVSQDPLGLLAGENVYCYPVNSFTYTDPLGLKCPEVESGGGKTNSNSTELQTFYPPNDGALGTPTREFLMPGQRIDRFGRMGGRYFSPEGTPLDMRALPPNADLTQYRVFEVIKPFEVESSTIAPYFNKIGLGKQYFSPVSAETLIKKGIIKIVL